MFFLHSRILCIRKLQYKNFDIRTRNKGDPLLSKPQRNQGMRTDILFEKDLGRQQNWGLKTKQNKKNLVFWLKCYRPIFIFIFFTTLCHCTTPNWEILPSALQKRTAAQIWKSWNPLHFIEVYILYTASWNSVAWLCNRGQHMYQGTEEICLEQRFTTAKVLKERYCEPNTVWEASVSCFLQYDLYHSAHYKGLVFDHWTEGQCSYRLRTWRSNLRDVTDVIGIYPKFKTHWQ